MRGRVSSPSSLHPSSFATFILTRPEQVLSGLGLKAGQVAMVSHEWVVESFKNGEPLVCAESEDVRLD